MRAPHFDIPLHALPCSSVFSHCRSGEMHVPTRNPGRGSHTIPVSQSVANCQTPPTLHSMVTLWSLATHARAPTGEHSAPSSTSTSGAPAVPEVPPDETVVPEEPPAFGAVPPGELAVPALPPSPDETGTHWPSLASVPGPQWRLEPAELLQETPRYRTAQPRIGSADEMGKGWQDVIGVQLEA